MSLLGNVDEISRSRVSGWAMNPDHADETIEIVVRVNGREHSRGKADQFREGLKEHLGGNATGKYDFSIDFQPPLSIFRDYKIEVVADNHDARLAGWTQELWSPKPAPGHFTPIIITSTGRSGTTLLMDLLKRHPRIVAADRYPYEVKLVAYYAAALQALIPNADRENSTDPIRMFERRSKFTIGHNPYNEPGLHSIIRNKAAMATLFDATIPLRYGQMFKQNIEDYYDLIKQDQGKPDATFFIEKGELDETARQGVRHLFGAVREIVMVRDPRDMLCSAKAFWNLPSNEALQMMSTTLPRLEKIHNSDSKDTFFVRYMDLINNPTQTVSAITRFIGVEPLPAPDLDIGGETELFTAHGTSRTPTASVGRWKTDLTDQEVQYCDRMFKSYMKTFDYA